MKKQKQQTLDELMESLGLVENDKLIELNELLNIKKAKETINSIPQEELVDLYYDDPIGYAEDVLSFYPDEYQKEIMASILNYKRVSVRSGQGIGKTATVACLIIWYLHMRYEAKIIATAPTAQQLSVVLWAEIAKWLIGTQAEVVLEITKTSVYRKGFELNWFANAKVAAKKENMLGLHADNLFIICDEAPGIKDEILEALMGTVTGEENKMLLIGNPTKNSGIFFDTHHTLKHKFKTIHINAEDVERTDKEQHEMLKTKYGEKSNVVRVLIRGEFPLEEDDVFFSYSKVKMAMNREPNKIKPNKKELPLIDIGCDVARFGNDSSCITYAVNDKVYIYKKYNGKDTMKTAGYCLLLAETLHKQFPKAFIPIKVDDTGVGGGVVDRLSELKREEGLDWLRVLPITFGTRIKHKYYSDSTTYMASILKELIDNDNLTLPNDTDLLAQLTTRKYFIASDRKIRLESKEELKKRGLPSPDIADALFLTLLPVKRNLK